ncbi:hypothetical protein DTO164E3_6715 [Paecilomyces variotii]|nr:hypothetical protein DTO164E3_6715 [Paecilomyces variotii]
MRLLHPIVLSPVSVFFKQSTPTQLISTIMRGGRSQDDYQSMDETALIAMGILLEEMAQEYLGETGDLILVEEEEIR